MDHSSLSAKKKRLDALRPLPPALVKNLEAWFSVELTYTSNAIEGNTLNRRETAVVIEKGLTIGGKTLKEHVEATNHAQALEYVRSLVFQGREYVRERDILEIHQLILKSIDDEHAGHYRSIPVRISGSRVILPNPRKVPDLMADFANWLKSSSALHPVAFASEAHYRLVTIHPFVDGNGRTARLLMNLLLLIEGYAPAIIRKRDRLPYLAALEQAQLGGSKQPYEQLITEAANRGLTTYLSAVQGKKDPSIFDADVLLKIGELASATQLSIPTIRHWVEEGLVEVAERTPSGYQLFSPEMVERVQSIQRLKKQRKTLQEIKTIVEAAGTK